MASKIQRVTFPGSTDAELSARLDLPGDPPRAFALFAHCFTCGKDVVAASRIARSLTDQGFGVLRFDFTGLGMSEGEFANTNFSSNTEDIVAAVDWLRREYAAPQVLIGHSLGGSAVLAVAGDVEEVRAVVTIGAPASPEHVTGVFSRSSLEEIEASGVAEVDLAGRPFTIRKQFLDDLGAHMVTGRAASMRKALLVLHSPIDNTVSVDNAAEIFGAARHPKSFVALDGADHLLTDRTDASFAASMIGSFATRYIADESGSRAAPRPSAQVVVSETNQGKFLSHVVIGQHRLLADEPESVGGFDAGPTPYDLLAAALGACTSMTLRMYAERKNMPLDHVSVDVSHGKHHVDDCAECVDDERFASLKGKIDRFERVLHLAGADLTEQDRTSLLRIADRCPVHRTLESTSAIATSLAD